MANVRSASLLLVCSLCAGRSLGVSITSFVSNEGLYCADGPPRLAEAALAMKKAAPAGAMFNNSFGVSNVSCASRGFHLNAGADSCTPDVTTYYKSDADRRSVEHAFSNAIEDFATVYGLDVSSALLMSNCTCKPGSLWFNSAGDQCAALKNTTGCWVHRDPYNGKTLMCDEGPFVYATRALSVLKSSPQLAMHFRDQIAPTSCTAFGFPLRFPPDDHCYPKMHIYTRESIYTDPGIKESEAVEANLTSGGFIQFARKYGIGNAHMLNNSLGCNCLPTSSVGKNLSSVCWSGKPSDIAHSPVRDWWSGDLDELHAFLI